MGYVRFRGGFVLEVTWRIIPFSVFMINKFPKGLTSSLNPTLAFPWSSGKMGIFTQLILVHMESSKFVSTCIGCVNFYTHNEGY